MKTRLMMIAATLIASLLCLPAMAQPGTGMGGGMGGMNGMGPGSTQGGGPGARGPQDCSQSLNPAACTAHRDARAKAREACQGKAPGPERRQCMQEQRQNFDRSKTADPSRCDVHQKARAACKDKYGPEHRSCLREQFNVK